MHGVRVCGLLILGLLAGCSNPTGGATSGNSSTTVLVPSVLGASGMQVYPGPGANAYLSTRYQVEVFDGGAWESSYTYQFSRVAKTPWHQGSSPSVHFTTFATAASSRVRLTNLSGTITSIAVSPLSQGVTATLAGNQATFTLSQHQKVWITVNGDDANPVFVFADGPKPVPAGANLLYLGPGVTNLGHYQATSGEIIYLDGGAVVRGNISIAGTKNVQIVGPGILTGDLWTAESVQALPFSQETAYAMITGDFNNSDNARVSEITILDSPFYNFFGGVAQVSDVKELSPWYWSTDGFQAVNHIDQSFAFVGDNVFFPAWAGVNGDGVTVTNSFAGTTNNAVFCGGFWGNVNSLAYPYSSTMSNIDVKTYTNGAWGTHTPAVFQIWVNNAVSTSGYANQTYENIRIEGSLASNLAELTNVPYPAAWGTPSYNPPLGNSYNLTFRQITLAGTQTGLSLIHGWDGANGFHSVTWQTLSINGSPVTSSNLSTVFSVNSFVWGLSFL